jgi:hypothetical protein
MLHGPESSWEYLADFDPSDAKYRAYDQASGARDPHHKVDGRARVMPLDCNALWLG